MANEFQLDAFCALQAAATLLSSDHKALLQLENAIAASGSAKPKIWSDLQVVFTPPIRLLFLKMEEDSYNPRSPGSLHLLRGMLWTLPDSKIVEDVHGNLRNNSKKGVNKKRALAGLQECVLNSKVLETREINHKAFVTKEVFLQAFPRTKDQKRSRHVGPKHQRCHGPVQSTFSFAKCPTHPNILFNFCVTVCFPGFVWFLGTGGTWLACTSFRRLGLT